jgi:hypothetical protein
VSVCHLETSTVRQPRLDLVCSAEDIEREYMMQNVLTCIIRCTQCFWNHKFKRDNMRRNALSEMRYDYKILVLILEDKRPLSQF